MIFLTLLIINLHLQLELRKKSIKQSHKHFSDNLANESRSTIFPEPTYKEEVANSIYSLDSNKAYAPNMIPYKILFILRKKL